MRLFRSALTVALVSASFTTADAQSASTPEPAQSSAPSIVLTTARTGGVATVRSADGRFSIQGDRIEITSAAPALSESTALIPEAAAADDDVVLEVTREQSGQTAKFSAQRFILSRDATSAQLQIRGENRRAP
jgi:hypothetical protein